MEIDLNEAVFVDLRGIMTPGNLFYFYKATVLNIVDGDTVDLEVLDLGMRIYRSDIRVRFKSVNTWETHYRQKGLTDEEWDAHREKGLDASEFLETLFVETGTIPHTGGETEPDPKPIVIQTYKDEEGNFGRLLGDLFIPYQSHWIAVSETLKKFGYEKTMDGKVPSGS